MAQEVIYDADCGLCDFTRRSVSRLDWLRQFQWTPFQTGRGASLGLSGEAVTARLHLVKASGQILAGFHAVRRMALHLPLFWIVSAAALAATPGTARIILAALIALPFTPLADAAGEAAYDWVARNRYRLFPGACKVEPGVRK